MKSVQIFAVTLLLIAGGALARDKKKEVRSKSPEAALMEGNAPKTCADQCKLLEKVMTDPCKKGAGTNKQAQKSCADNARQMVEACNGSCDEKGRIDKQYMMEHIKPPSGYKAGQGAKGGASASSKGEGDAQ